MLDDTKANPNHNSLVRIVVKQLTDHLGDNTLLEEYEKRHNSGLPKVYMDSLFLPELPLLDMVTHRYFAILDRCAEEHETSLEQYSAYSLSWRLREMGPTERLFMNMNYLFNGSRTIPRVSEYEQLIQNCKTGSSQQKYDDLLTRYQKHPYAMYETDKDKIFVNESNFLALLAHVSNLGNLKNHESVAEDAYGWNLYNKTFWRFTKIWDSLNSPKGEEKV